MSLGKGVGVLIAALLLGLNWACTSGPPPPAPEGVKTEGEKPVREASAGGEACPDGDTVAAAIRETFRREVEVKQVRPAPVEGLCEIVVSVQGGPPNIIYSDPAGRRLVTGQIIDVEGRQDLTREGLADYNRFSPEEMARLESLTALTLGTGGQEVYFVTDPQ